VEAEQQHPNHRGPRLSDAVTMAAISSDARSANAVLGWRMPSPTTTWSYLYGGSRQTG
jgi:hypothetical protein